MRIVVSKLNTQFNVTLSPELKERLQQLAEEFEIEPRKGTKVGALIIKAYVDRWVYAQRRIREAKQKVEQEIMEEERPALVTGETPKANPTARRKKKP